MTSLKIRVTLRCAVALLFLGSVACCRQTCPTPMIPKPIPTTNAGCLRNTPPPPPPDWQPEDLLTAGMGDCPGNVKTIAGCLSPAGAVKMKSAFKRFYSWIKEAQNRCGGIQ